MTDKTKKYLFFLMTILTPIIFYMSYLKVNEIEDTAYKGPRRPMVELTDVELSKIFGQAGIHFVNENFNIHLTPDEAITIGDFHNQLLNHMFDLQNTNPEEAMQTYANMIQMVNNSNPNMIAGPGTLHFQTEIQPVMESVIMNGVQFMTTTSEQMGFGTFGIQGLNVHFEGTFHLFVRND